LNKKKKNGGADKAAGRKAASNHTSDSPMDVGLLERIVKLMASNDLNTVDVRDGDKRVILKRGAMMVAAPSMATYAPAPQSTTPAASSGGATSPVDEDAGLVAIKSPMVGTFYAAGSPEARPFVSVGTRVDEETDVCIIEAMKVFNNIKAETRGTIAKVLVSNGETVEFGQTLFLVKP
jgi:acetyl-CoA carboxylase biotin carboxyl carrier protein